MQRILPPDPEKLSIEKQKIVDNLEKVTEKIPLGIKQDPLFVLKMTENMIAKLIEKIPPKTKTNPEFVTRMHAMLETLLPQIPFPAAPSVASASAAAASSSPSSPAQITGGAGTPAPVAAAATP